MSTRTLPDRRAVLRGGAAVIASAAMFAPLRDQRTANAKTLRTEPSPSATAHAPQRRKVPVGLL